MRRRLLIVAIPAMVFTVYLLTLYPTVGWVDCGEIAAGCYMLNVLHPTGYPLYTLIGHLFSHVPLGTVATRINALSALLSSVAALFCFLTVERLTRSRVAGIVSAALYAFSFTIWQNSVDADVFGLTALYVALTIYLLVRFRDSPNLLLVAYLLGVALTNHISFMSTFVGTSLYLSLIYRGELFRRRVLVSAAIMFLLGLSPYGYLLVRSQSEPLLNWGNAHNLERLIWHVTGRQYQVWMFSLPLSEILGNLGKALGMLAQELYYVLIPVFLWGAWTLFRRSREFFWLLAVVFALNVLYAVNYSIPDIQSYYIPFMIAAFIFTGVGLAEVIRRLAKAPQYAFLALALVPLAVNHRRAGAQGNYVTEDFGLNHLRSAPDSAIVMTVNWDIYSPVFYLRHIQGMRPDLCIVDKELLRRSWYLQSLRNEYPWLIARSQAEVDAYLRYLDEFEHNTLRDVKGIQTAYTDMISSFVRRNPERRVFLTFDQRSDNDAKDIAPERVRVPYGLYYELEGDTMPHRVPLVPDTFDYRRLVLRKGNVPDDERTRINLGAYERFACERAAYLAGQGRTAEAQTVLEWVIHEFPSSQAARSLIRRLGTP